MNGTVVRADCIVKMNADDIEAGRNESHDRNEPGRSAGGALGRTEPFIESVGVQEAVRGIVSGWIVN